MCKLCRINEAPTLEVTKKCALTASMGFRVVVRVKGMIVSYNFITLCKYFCGYTQTRIIRMVRLNSLNYSFKLKQVRSLKHFEVKPLRSILTDKKQNAQKSPSLECSKAGFALPSDPDPSPCGISSDILLCSRLTQKKILIIHTIIYLQHTFYCKRIWGKLHIPIENMFINVRCPMQQNFLVGQQYRNSGLETISKATKSYTFGPITLLLCFFQGQKSQNQAKSREKSQKKIRPKAILQTSQLFLVFKREDNLLETHQIVHVQPTFA